jgi:hypothetical protein
MVEIALAACIAVAVLVLEARRLRAFLRDLGARWLHAFMSL